VQGRRARVDEILNELGDSRSGGPVGGESGALLRSRDLSGEEEPEESLRERLVSSGSLGKELLALGDGLSSVERSEGRRQARSALLLLLRGFKVRKRMKKTNRNRIPSSEEKKGSERGQL